MSARPLLLLLLATLAACRVEMSDSSAPTDPRPNDQLLRQASEGDLSAQHRLCYRFQYGDEGVERDDAEALHWCDAAAKNGGPAAMALLAEIYYRVNGVAKDYPRAFDLYRQAGDHGHPHGLFMVGLMYRDGQGVPRDREQAIEWLKKADAAGHEHAKHVLEELGAGR